MRIWPGKIAVTSNAVTALFAAEGALVDHFPPRLRFRATLRAVWREDCTGSAPFAAWIGLEDECASVRGRAAPGPQIAAVAGSSAARHPTLPGANP